MRDLLFDTSVYGELADDAESLRSVAGYINTSFVAFGSSTVREELEETPPITVVSRGKFKGLNLKELLLWIYRLFVEESGGEILTTDLVEMVALRYQLELGSKAARKQTLNDFRIVAAATLQAIGLFVSADKKQISEAKKSVYVSVNTHYQLSTPELLPYADFKQSPGKYSDEGQE